MVRGAGLRRSVQVSVWLAKMVKSPRLVRARTATAPNVETKPGVAGPAVGMPHPFV